MPLVIIVYPLRDDQRGDAYDGEYHYKVDPGHRRGKAVIDVGDHLLADLLDQLIVRPHTEIHDCIDPVHQEQRAHHREGDLPEALPRRTALDGRRLVHAVGDRLQPGEEDDDLDARGNGDVVDAVHDIEHDFEGPDAHARGHQDRLQGIAHARHIGRLLHHALHAREQRVVCLHAEDHARREDHGKKEDRAHQRPALEFLVEDQRHEEAEHHDRDGVDAHPRDLLHQQPVELGVDREGLYVIVQTDIGIRDTLRAHLHVAEAHVERLAQRNHHKGQKAYDKRRDKQVSRYRLSPLKPCVFFALLHSQDPFSSNI